MLGRKNLFVCVALFVAVAACGVREQVRQLEDDSQKKAVVEGDGQDDTTPNDSSAGKKSDQKDTLSVVIPDFGEQTEEAIHDLVVDGDLGKYKLYLAATDFLHTTIMFKDEPPYAWHRNCYAIPLVWDDKWREAAPDVDFQINGKNTDALMQQYTLKQFAGLFGSPATFRITSADKASGAVSSDELTLYLPQLLEIASPQITEQTMHPVCYFKNFVLRWNADGNNPNGVVIMVEWHGTKTYGDDVEGAEVTHVLCVEDTGEALLPEAMFKGIPDTAFCKMTLIRGDLEVFNFVGYSHKVVAAVQSGFHFILVRSLTSN